MRQPTVSACPLLWIRWEKLKEIKLKILAYFSWMCCVVTEFVYANTIIFFNLGEKWLLEYAPPCLACRWIFCHYSPRFQRIIVKYQRCGWIFPLCVFVTCDSASILRSFFRHFLIFLSCSFSRVSISETRNYSTFNFWNIVESPQVHSTASGLYIYIKGEWVIFGSSENKYIHPGGNSHI